MLAIFNETKNPWSFTSINEYMGKISTTVIDRNNTKRTLDLLVSADVKIEDCDTIVSSNECKTLFNDKTLVRYQKKDFSPMVVHNEKTDFNTDTLVMSFDLGGKIVKEIKALKSVRVFNHFFKKGILALAVNLGVENSVYEFEITFFDKKSNTDVTYRFTRTEGDAEYNVSIVECEAAEDDIIDAPTYKIMHYRPLRPTHAIIVRDSDREEFFKSFTKYERHYICSFKSNDELTSVIEGLKNEKYKAVTLFVNRERDNTQADTTAFNAVRDAFRVMLIINSTGRVSIIK